MRSPARIGVAAGLAVAALVLASVALAAFTPRVTISGTDASSPAVAISDGGDAVAAWTRFDGSVSRVQARTVSAGGGLGPVHTLSVAGDSAFNPQVAVDADGDAIVVWTRLHGRVIAEAARISAAGVVGPVVELSPAGEDAAGAQVATDGDGDAVVLWYRSNVGNLRVLGRAIPAAGTPGPVLRLSRPPAGGSQPRLGVTSAGDGYAVWVGSDGANSRAQGRAIDTAGNLGPIRNLSAAGANAGFPRVDVDDFGNAFAIWTRAVGSNTRVQGRPVPAFGAPGPITTLSAAGQNAILPEISIGGGNGVAVWARQDGSDLRIQAVALSPVGGTGTPTTLSVAGEGATNPDVAVDGSGNSQVVWQRFDGSHQRVQERPFSNGATPKPIENLSSPGVDAAVPAIAVSPGGQAVAVWTEPGGNGHQRIEASRGP